MGNDAIIDRERINIDDRRNDCRKSRDGWYSRSSVVRSEVEWRVWQFQDIQCVFEDVERPVVVAFKLIDVGSLSANRWEARSLYAVPGSKLCIFESR